MIDCEVISQSNLKFFYKYENKVVAFVLVEDALDFINIVDVFVDEVFRRRGIAFKIFEFIFNKYKDRDVKFMLEVRCSNVPAISLYERLGFRKIYVRKNYYGNEDAIIMEVKR